MITEMGMPSENGVIPSHKFYNCCGQSLPHPIVGNENLQKKSALIGGISDGDPPTVKSERKLGNSRKESRSSTREGEGEG